MKSLVIHYKQGPLVLLLTMLLWSANVLGQTMPPASDSAWTVFTPSDSRFSVELPGTPKENALGFETVLQPKTFRCAEQLRYAYVLNTDTPTEEKTTVDLGVYAISGCKRSDSDLKKEARRFTGRYVADDPGDKVLREERFSKNGVKGWFYVSRTHGGHFVYQLFAQSKDSLYLLSYVSRGETPTEPGRIFGSFRINK